MKKKSIILMLLTLLFGALSVSSVFASGSISVTGNVSEDAIITNKEGQVISHTEQLSQWTPYNVKYDLTITSGNVQDGTKINIELPNNVQVKQTITNVPVYSSTNEQVGVFEINKGSRIGTITITNAKAINDTPLNRKMSISFGVYGTREDNTPSPDWIINKVAWTDNVTHNIVWNVAVNNIDGTSNKIVIHDMPDSNSELVSSTVSVQYGHYNSDEKFVVEREGTLPITKTSDGFTVNLGNYTEKNAQITYETKPIKQGFITNKVELVVNNEVKGTNEATIDYTAKGDYDGSSLITSSSSSKTSSLSSSSVSSTSSHVSSLVSHKSSSILSSSKSSLIDNGSVSSSSIKSHVTSSSLNSSSSKTSSNSIKSSAKSSSLKSSVVTSLSSSQESSNLISSTFVNSSSNKFNSSNKDSSISYDNIKSDNSTISHSTQDSLSRTSKSKSVSSSSCTQEIEHSYNSSHKNSGTSSTLVSSKNSQKRIKSSRAISSSTSSKQISKKVNSGHNIKLPDLGVSYNGICKVIITIAISIILISWLA